MKTISPRNPRVGQVGKLNEALDKSYRRTDLFLSKTWTSSTYRWTFPLFDNIYNDTLANEQPSYLTIISLYTSKTHAFNDWFDVIRLPYSEESDYFASPTRHSLFIPRSVTRALSLSPPLSFFSFFCFFYTLRVYRSSEASANFSTGKVRVT